MRRVLFVILTLCLHAASTPAEPRRKPLRIVFLDNGGTVAEEVRLGIEAAARYYDGIEKLRDHPVEAVIVDADQEPRALEEAIEKAKPVAVIAAPRSREVEGVVRLARRVRIPFLLATHWEPTFSLDPRDPVIHVGGNAVDQAVDAAGYCKIPLAASRVAALHDGSGPSKALAESFLRNRYEGTVDGGAHLVPQDRGDVGGLLQRLGTRKVGVVFAALDHEDALRVAMAAEDLDRRARWAERERDDGPVDRHKVGMEPKSTTPKRPRLLFADGVVTRTMGEEAPLTARFMVGTNPYLERDRPTFFKSIRKTREEMPSSAGERGYFAAVLILEGLAATRVRRRGLLPAMAALGYEDFNGATLLTEWGQTRYFTWHLWKATGTAAIRVRPTFLPDKIGGLLLRQRTSAKLRWEPGTRLIHLTWGEPDEQTIDADLRRIGLSTRGYEAAIDAMIKDELLVRAAARLNRLFWRNADGTPIPGVSFNITFVTEIPPGHDEHHWGAKIAGDHPSSGGLAGDPYSSIFSTFIVRTMYLKHRLVPRIRREDLDYFKCRYEWGTELKRNLRNDEIRCLLEGVSGAFAMTTAHELGHVAGCGHDQVSPRSIMNVAEGAGLDPDWAEWIPQHVKALRTRLGLYEPRRGRRR